MKTYYEKRSVAEDGLPEKPEELIWISTHGHPYTYTEIERLPNLVWKNCHYLIEVPDPEQRAVEFAEWIKTSSWNPTKRTDNALWLNAQSAEKKTTAELFSLYLTSTGQQSENKTEQK